MSLPYTLLLAALILHALGSLGLSCSDILTMATLVRLFSRTNVLVVMLTLPILLLPGRLKPLLSRKHKDTDADDTGAEETASAEVVLAASEEGADPAAVNVPLRCRACKHAGRHVDPPPCQRCCQLSSRRHRHRQQEPVSANRPLELLALGALT